MKFSVGDRIRVKEADHLATVKGVSFNSIQQEWEYYVIWDSFPEKGECCYMAADSDNIWEKVAQIKDGIIGFDPAYGYVNQDPDFLPPGFRGVQPGDTVKKECEHKWVEVGFTFTKTVCYHCDKEKT